MTMKKMMISTKMKILKKMRTSMIRWTMKTMMMTMRMMKELVLPPKSISNKIGLKEEIHSNKREQKILGNREENHLGSRAVSPSTTKAVNSNNIREESPSIIKEENLITNKEESHSDNRGVSLNIIREESLLTRAGTMEENHSIRKENHSTRRTD